MKKNLTIISLLACIVLNAQNKVDWLTHFGGNSTYYGVELGRKITHDNNGNLYVVGEFGDTIEVDGHTMVSNGLKEIFLAKINPSGSVEWIKNFGGVMNDWSGGVCVDDNSNIYITGTFRGDITIGDSLYIGNSPEKLNAAYDFFVAKLNQYGELIWSRGFIGNTNVANSTRDLIKDNSGNIYITGYYLDTLNLDGNILYGPRGRSDLFVAKLNGLSGKVMWANSTKSNANNYGNSIVYDDKNHLYLTGFVSDSAYFNNHLITSAGVKTSFLAKMDASSGEFVWAIGGEGGHGWNEGNSLTIDHQGDIVLSGWYRNDVYFGLDSLTNEGLEGGPDDIYVAKFDTAGNILWLEGTESNSYSSSNGICINDSNDIYISGKYRGTLSIQDSSYSSTIPLYFDICVLKFNNDGNFQWMKSFGGDSPMNDIGYGISHFGGEVFITGQYSSRARFDRYTPPCNGASDVFVVKLSDTITEGIGQNSDADIFTVYPNPFQDFIQIKTSDHFQDEVEVILYNQLGRMVLRKKILGSGVHTLEIPGLSSGIYYLQLSHPSTKMSIINKILKE